MLADSMIVPQCVYRPGSFSGLMTIYESNYLKFDQLILKTLPEEPYSVSRISADCDLHLEILRREPYTSTVKLTYWLEDDGGQVIPDPDLVVRIYHDARLVEGVGGRNNHHHHVLKSLALSHAGELDRRWQVNIMLNKWLDYLLDNGHGFE
jgi:uncharacterized protein YqiB (DUF1249 family)